MCLYPKLVQNPRYKKNKKNNGIIPVVFDTRILHVPIGCGNCIECRKQKQREWLARLNEDIKTNTNGRFITLTFSNESIKKLSEQLPEHKGYAFDNAIATLAVRRFLERYRKKYKTSIRHWLITELGHKGTNNIHLHGILWTNTNLDEIEKIWQYGYVWKGKRTEKGKIINYVNNTTIGYITKYVTKIDEVYTTYKNKILCSKGIGSNYTKTSDFKRNKFNYTETKEYYKTSTGHKIALPIYWRNKIYTDQEKEQLWINKLNKNERYILGVKIDVSTNMHEYYNSLKFAQIKNKELGYNNNNTNWNAKIYENERRQMLTQERINKAITTYNKKNKIANKNKTDYMQKEIRNAVEWELE